MFYKYGGKQLYYNNTFDGQGEIDINKEDTSRKNVEANFIESSNVYLDEDDCESCKI